MRARCWAGAAQSCAVAQLQSHARSPGRVVAEADILIIDSPPATAFADAALLSTQVNGVLLVIDAGRTPA